MCDKPRPPIGPRGVGTVPLASGTGYEQVRRSDGHGGEQATRQRGLPCRWESSRQPCPGEWYCHILTTLSFVCFLSAQACFQKTPLDFLPQSRIVWKNGSSVVRHSHARQTVGTRITLPTTERLAWQCGDHTVKLESAVCRRFHVTKICCFSVARGTAQAVVLARSPPPQGTRRGVHRV